MGQGAAAPLPLSCGCNCLRNDEFGEEVSRPPGSPQGMADPVAETDAFLSGSHRSSGSVCDQEAMERPMSPWERRLEMRLPGTTATQSQVQPVRLAGHPGGNAAAAQQALDLNTWWGSAPKVEEARQTVARTKHVGRVGMEGNDGARGVCSRPAGCTLLLFLFAVGLIGLALLTFAGLPDPTPAVAAATPQPSGAPQAEEDQLQQMQQQQMQQQKQQQIQQEQQRQQKQQWVPPAATMSAPAAQAVVVALAATTTAPAPPVAVVVAPPVAPAAGPVAPSSPDSILAKPSGEGYDCSLVTGQTTDSWPKDKQTWCCETWGRGCPTLLVVPKPEGRLLQGGL